MRIFNTFEFKFVPNFKEFSKKSLCIRYPSKFRAVGLANCAIFKDNVLNKTLTKQNFQLPRTH